MSSRVQQRGGFDRLGDEGYEARPKCDIKRMILIVGLGALSWVATYVGMLELIEANMGDLPLVHKVIIAFSVAMLMTMIVWLLDQLFRPQPFITKVCYFGGYVFLSLISIGFGFGFYWKVLESRGEASRSAESAVSQVQSALHGASTRLDQLQGTLVQLTQVSNAKAELEQTKGSSCPNSKPGDGPRRKMREDDAQRFQFASDFVKGRADSVKSGMSALDGDLAKIVSADASTFDPKTGTRNEFMKALSRKLDLTVTGFNAFRSDPQLTQVRTDLAERAERTTLPDGRGGSLSCPDPQLQMALRGVVKAIDQLPELSKPEIAAVEGSEATIEAFRRLTATFYGALAFKLPPSADELRELQKKAVQSVENPDGAAMRAMRAADGQEAGLSRRDYVPLAVAVFVDLCLLLVSMVQRAPDRLNGLMPKMQAAERGPVIQILSRFNDIHRDRQIRENFEIFRHVVFDMHGDYYVAVPLDAPPAGNAQEREALRVEALLLGNLFASFEKEKIFKRTMLPAAGSVRKRLARQGSKFAGSEAFRVYKFSDGAWSDIILGAVMGAARRAEAQARAAANTNEPMLPGSDDFAPRSGEGPATKSEPSFSAGVTQDASVRSWRERSGGLGLRMDDSGLEDVARDSTTSSEPMRTARQDEAADAEGAAMPAANLPDADHVARFGPYARFNSAPRVEPKLGAADEPRVRAVGQRIVPLPAVVRRDGQLGASGTVAAEPVEESRTRVTLSRETATFSMPAGSAALPPSLKLALDRLDAAAELQPEADDGRVLPPPLEDGGQDALSDADRALIGRMAPPAAE